MRLKHGLVAAQTRYRLFLRRGMNGKEAKGRRMNVITRQVYYFEDLEVGMEASFAKTVSEADIVCVRRGDGRQEPRSSRCRRMPPRPSSRSRIAHGMLTAGYISAVFGMELPGPGAIYVSQTLNFRGPVQDRRPRGGQGAGDGALSRQAPRPLRVRLLGRRQAGAGRRGRADGAQPRSQDQGGVATPTTSSRRRSHACAEP